MITSASGHPLLVPTLMTGVPDVCLVSTVVYCVGVCGVVVISVAFTVSVEGLLREEVMILVLLGTCGVKFCVITEVG